MAHAQVMTLTEGEYVEVLYTDPSGWSYGRVRNAKPAREGWCAACLCCRVGSDPGRVTLFGSDGKRRKICLSARVMMFTRFQQGRSRRQDVARRGVLTR